MGRPRLAGVHPQLLLSRGCLLDVAQHSSVVLDCPSSLLQVSLDCRGDLQRSRRPPEQPGRRPAWRQGLVWAGQSTVLAGRPSPVEGQQDFGQ